MIQRVDMTRRSRCSRLYQLVRQRDAITDHTFEIRFLDAGVEAYAPTFG
jgi:Thioredoxin like C-terminal domain